MIDGTRPIYLFLLPICHAASTPAPQRAPGTANAETGEEVVVGTADNGGVVDGAVVTVVATEVCPAFTTNFTVPINPFASEKVTK